MPPCQRRDDVGSVRTLGRSAMIWPFVSRATVERLDELWLAEVSRMEERQERFLAAERERYEALAARYHALKLAGASIPEPAPALAAKPEPDPVTQAIIKKAGTSRQLRKHYADYVTEQRAAGTDDEEIAQAILQGQDDDGGVP